MQTLPFTQSSFCLSCSDNNSVCSSDNNNVCSTVSFAAATTSSLWFSLRHPGDSIMVAYNNKKCYIDIIETKPSNAISIIETDYEVDFAPPLDYKEPEKLVAIVPSSKALTKGQEAPAETEPKFNPFTGSGRRLDGKPLNYEPPSVSSSSLGSKDKRPNVANGGGQQGLLHKAPLVKLRESLFLAEM
ncbi:hypothetical protein LOK49_LG03G00181 [Camellia lanceoleosa]|uniref:Uncharacterized protein n=1 Tax=Camellia lanceoleosa TaxID=1840588 RepID=A0ACC0IKA8_9ERIC|nr:hypothetical protein LOK49_LG03G00181 [Camellia lanceoleosa]